MAEDARQDLADRFVAAVEYLNRQLHGARLDQWQQFDMTIPQVKTLLLLADVETARMGGIARHLGTSLSATTAIVDRLVDRGLVGRGSDPTDRRVVTCELTREGTAAVEQFWRVDQTWLEPIVGGLDDAELQAGVRILESIRAADEQARREEQSAD
ncbi:MAG: MarR family transcriptional regulator [Chloroflexi bacterium]|nr:MarR family transcriptional regulator [Chloroflexota bacterium]